MLTSGNYIVSDLAMQVYPNPTNGVFELRFKSDATINSMIQLFDITGRKFMLKKSQLKTVQICCKLMQMSFQKGCICLS